MAYPDIEDGSLTNVVNPEGSEKINMYISPKCETTPG
jgi:hypothetical protein